MDASTRVCSPCASHATLFTHALTHPTPVQGSFRPQDPSSWNGKVLKVTGTTLPALTLTPAGVGMLNPWRFAWDAHSLASAGAGPSSSSAVTGSGRMYSIDTGLVDRDEVNFVPVVGSSGGTSSPPNFGFPCMSGTVTTPLFYPTCISETGWGSAASLPTFTPPLWSYTRSGAPGVLSALAVHPLTGRVWVGDYMNALVSVTAHRRSTARARAVSTPNHPSPPVHVCGFRRE